MKTFTEYNDRINIEGNRNDISEGFFDWLKTLYKRTTKSAKAIEKRFGKIDPIVIKDVKTLQATKVIKGKMENEIAKDMGDSGFILIKKMFSNKKDYFADKDGKEISCELLNYIYTPENPLSKDEKYFVALAIKPINDTGSYLEDYIHINDFEISSNVKNDKAIGPELFELWVDNNVKSKFKSAKGVTIKYVNNTNDFINLKYKGKTFDVADDTIKLLKLDF